MAIWLPLVSFNLIHQWIGQWRAGIKQRIATRAVFNALINRRVGLNNRINPRIEQWRPDVKPYIETGLVLFNQVTVLSNAIV